MIVDMLDWPNATLFYSIGWYLFFRGISKYTTGEIVLTKWMRWLFFPFSKRRSTNRGFLIAISFGYVEFLMFLLSKVPFIAHCIGDDFYHYNLAALGVLLLSSAPIFFWGAFERIRGSTLTPHIIDKIVFYFTILMGLGCLIFFSLAIIGSFMSLSGLM